MHKHFLHDDIVLSVRETCTCVFALLCGETHRLHPAAHIISAVEVACCPIVPLVQTMTKPLSMWLSRVGSVQQTVVSDEQPPTTLECLCEAALSNDNQSALEFPSGGVCMGSARGQLLQPPAIAKSASQIGFNRLPGLQDLYLESTNQHVDHLRWVDCRQCEHDQAPISFQACRNSQLILTGHTCCKL